MTYNELVRLSAGEVRDLLEKRPNHFAAQNALQARLGRKTATM